MNSLPRLKVGDYQVGVFKVRLKSLACRATHRYSRADNPPLPLRKIRVLGFVLLGIQFLAFAIWSGLLASRFALSKDFSIYSQAWFLIAHGQLSPFSTALGYPFWMNHTELIMWPLAGFYWLWPHSITLLWIQDACVVGAEAIVFVWMCELVERRLNVRGARWIAASGLLLLVLNPWVWWAISFDFHIEAIALLFVLLAGWDFVHGRRRSALWIFLAFLCGAVALTYTIGLGLSAILAGRRWRARGVGLVFASVVLLTLVTVIHGDQGASLATSYGYLATSGLTTGPLSSFELIRGIVTHPFRVLSTLWDKRSDLWANMAPSGFIGIVFIWVMPVIVIVLLSDSLFQGSLLAQPGFQSLPLYILTPLGTIAVITLIANRHRGIASILMLLVLVNAVGWAVVWGSRTSTQWLRVSAQTAETLNSVNRMIRPSDEVIASQGIVGRFAGRREVYDVSGEQTIPLSSNVVWFIIAAQAGIETASAASQDALVSYVASSLHASLVDHSNGVWAFRWNRGNHSTQFRSVGVSTSPSKISAWTSLGGSGTAVVAGLPSDWYLASNGSRGYVLAHDYWREPPGLYEVIAQVASDVPINFEVWNVTGGKLLLRRSIPATNGRVTLNVVFDATHIYTDPAVFTGWGPFRAVFSSTSFNQFEVRVWTPGAGVVSVGSVQIQKIVTNRASG